MVRLAMQRGFEKMGMEVTVDQWSLIMILGEHPNCSQRQLASLSGKDPASITRMLDVLERGQWINRGAVIGNRRKFNLQLTLKGQGLRKAYQGFVSDIQAKCLGGISKSEREDLRALLMKLQESASGPQMG